MDEDGLFERISWQLEAAPFDAQQKREVLARFGLAAYYGQCVERQIALMLATMYNKTIHQAWLDKMGITEDKVQAAMSEMKGEAKRNKPKP